MTTWQKGQPPAFPARYAGRCWTCEEPIKVGQPVTYDEDQLVHANCDTVPPSPPTSPPCPRCHMIPATNGTCECD